MALRLIQSFTWFCQKGLIVVDKSTSKVQFRLMEKSIHGISFGNWPITDSFHDQTICITYCENLTIGHSLISSKLSKKID